MKTTITAALTILAGLALAVVPAGPSSAATSFTFYGGGYGHGLGMSQWGTYGLARAGWSHQEILTHYYSGTEVGPVEGPKTLRIGLLQGAGRVTLEAEAGPVELRQDGPAGPLLASIPAGQRWTVEASATSFRILGAAGATGATGPAAAEIATSSSPKIAVRYKPLGSRVRIAESGHAYARGYLQLALSAPCDGCAPVIRAVAILAPQAYLYGLGEVPSSWPMEALEAQADAARSYAFNMVARAGQHRAGCDCALYGDPRDQVYVGYDKEAGTDGRRWVRAVDATRGEVVLSGGQPIPAFYSASSGGYTEDNENVWGGTPLPYLRGVCDPGDYTSANPYRTWVVGPLSAATVTSRLRPWTGDIGTVTRFGRTVRGVSGRIETVVVEGSSGSATITGSELRSGIGLRDDRVWINSDRLVRGPIRSAYDRLMCAPGLPEGPQVRLEGGARQRFAQGAIYVNAARHLTVWLSGPVQEAYVEAGQAGGALGLPASAVVRLTEGPGCDTQVCDRALFEHGRIYFKASTGAWPLFGRVLEFFLAHDGVLGRLGFPTSGVSTAPDGGTSAAFEGGVVTCPPAGRCTRTAA
ncbi:MAG: SpoIID/LytB domain-containing protein [Candidatus Velamenicoccus archaeovorus]